MGESPRCVETSSVLIAVKGVLSESQALSYREIQYSEIPDHLAILPFEKLIREKTK